VSPAERDALVRLRVEKGGNAEEVDALIRQVDDAAAKGVPAAPLVNKIREGLAKGVDSQRIELVVGQMVGHLETADLLLREGGLPGGGAAHGAAVTLMAESLGGGITPAEVRDLRRLAQAVPSPGGPLSGDSLASAAKGLWLVKDARLPAGDGGAVMAEAIRQGFRSYEILDLGREIHRRADDYRSGRASLRSLRDAIARGERPPQLFRVQPPDAVDRPPTARPDAPVERPPAPSRPAAPQRPERPVRPERPADGR
jgi:hypothetical protein